MRSEYFWCLLISLATTAWADAQSVDVTDDSPGGRLLVDVDPTEQRLLQILEQRRDVSLVEVPLTDFVKYLNSNGVPTFLSKHALEDAGVRLDTPITCQQTSARLIDVLELVLKEHELSWLIQDGVVNITTRESAGEKLMTKLYDVRNLVEFALRSPSRTREAVYEPDFDSLIRMITGTVAPDSWDHAGGPGSIEPYSTRRMRILVISQTYDVHLEIQNLLKRLGRIGGFAPLAAPAETKSEIISNNAGRMSGLRSSNLRRTENLRNQRG